MMLEEQLENRMFLNKAGAFSIRRSSRSVAESLAYSSEILSDSNNLLLMFPQGKFETLYTRYFVFESGIERILSGLPEPPEVYFMVNLVEYFTRQKPSLFIRIIKHEGDLSKAGLQEAYNRFFDKCVAKQSEDLV